MMSIKKKSAVLLTLLTLIGSFCWSINPTNADELLERIISEAPRKNTLRWNQFQLFEGQWERVGENVVSVQPSDGPKLLSVKPEIRQLSAGEVAVDLYFPQSPAEGYTNAGILLKVNDVGIGDNAFHGYEIALSPEHRHLNVGYHRQNYIPMEQVALVVPLDRWITLRVAFTKDQFTVYVEDKKIGKFDAPGVESGSIALRPWHRLVHYRDLRVRRTDEKGKLQDWELLPFFPPEENNFSDKSKPAWSASLETGDLPPILLMTRYPLTAPPAVGQDIWMAQPTKPGCSIRLIHPANPKLPTQTIFCDPTGCIYDMNLSLDAKTIFFSYRRDGERYWHLWKINVDGSGLEQLTEGPWCDISPCQTPQGEIIFVSTRRFGHTVCQPGPASNLHRLSGLGEGEVRKIGCISMNTLSDMSPQMLPDGRVVFTRWEYIDRDLTYRQSLWTQNPDGTGYQLFFGNTIRDVGTFWQARPVPGDENLLVATFAPHHNYPHGMIGLIDRKMGIEGKKGEAFFYLTNEVPEIGDRPIPWGYRDPFPVTDETFLCSYGDGVTLFPGGAKRFALYLLNREGETRLLYEDPVESCFFPIPLRESIPIRPVADTVEVPETQELESVDNDLPLGHLLLSNVYEGLGETVPPGSIKSLRVMEQVRKTYDLQNRAYDQSPVMSYATYYAKRNWGIVPVEVDGSAHFSVPALREIYLQALDADGREVQRMTSALQVMPGENLSCIGCHEPRDAASPTAAVFPIAARKAPVTPVIPDWYLNRERINAQPDAGIFDYPSIVQPVLDRYCVECHNGQNATGGYDLTGDKTRFFSVSYDNLLGVSRSYRQHDMETGEMLSQEKTKGKPLVHFFWLLFTPTSVNRPYDTGSYASRLTDIIDSDHAGVIIPPEERQKLYFWIDANAPYYGTYANARPGTAGHRDRFSDPKTEQPASWYTDEFSEVYQRCCVECHGSFEQPNHLDWIGRYSWINLDNPARSAALTAHLPRDHAGRGLVADRQNLASGKRETTNDTSRLLFESPQNADYRKMLRAIEKGKQIMLLNPEADMPGFKNARPEP